MKNAIRISTLVSAVLFATAIALAGQRVNPKADVAAAGFPPPSWAYPANPPDYVAPPDTGVPQHVPNSTVALTLTQIRDLFTPPDWHPEDHPAMPPIVGQGRKPSVWACGYCHLPTGWGKPENANVANLVTTGGGKTVQCTICHGADLRGIGPIPAIAGRSAIYTFRQLYDFKAGVRQGAWSAMMKPAVKNLTMDDMIAIVAYASSRMP